MKLLLSIGLLSAMLLTVQLALMHALAFVHGHHLAYVILSIALLGFGAGGSLLTLCRKMDAIRLQRGYGVLAATSGVFVAWIPRGGGWLLRGIEVDLLFTGWVTWLRLTTLGIFLLLPFCAGAMALTIQFRVQSQRIGSVYAANLAGSALGALLVIPLLMVSLPEQILPWIGMLGVAAGALCSLRPVRFLPGLSLVLLAIILQESWDPSPYRDLSYALQLPAHVARGPFPHFHGRVDIVEAPALRFAPDVSLQYRGIVPSVPHVFVQGEQVAPLLAPGHPGSRILVHTPQGLPYVLGPYRSVLFLAPGGNAPVLVATDVARVVHVAAPHPFVVRLLRGSLPAGVQLVRADARGYLAREQKESHDLIVFPMRGLFGGPGGLQTLGVDSLFTVEGVMRAWQLLDADGWLVFPVWIDDPLRHSLRVLALIRAVLTSGGEDDPAAHVVAIRGWGSVVFMVCRSPVGEEALSRVNRFTSEQGFDLLHPAPAGADMRHGPLHEPPAAWFRALLGPEADSFIDSYRFDIRAPTDARPFFNQFMRPGDHGRDLDWLSVSERGLKVLQWLLWQLLVAVVLVVLLPLLPLRRQLHQGAGTIGYFAGLGFGFMLYEVALIQLLIPLWGSAVMGAALVITTLLVGMTLGSLLVQKCPLLQARVAVLCSLSAAVLLVMGMLLPVLIRWVLPFGGMIRISILLPFLLLPAILLGMPFPVGIHYLDQAAPRQIPWACGIDGGMAVLAAPVSALLAFYLGYPVVVFIAASTYALSALSSFAGWRRKRTA